MLRDFLVSHRAEIVSRCRAKAAARSVPGPAKSTIEYGVPVFLDQLLKALCVGPPSHEDIHNDALLHGHNLLNQGFTLSQVVHDYGDVCQAIMEMAAENGVSIDANDFRALDRCLDSAISSAVTQYVRVHKQRLVDGETRRWNKRLEVLALELRSVLNVAIAAADTLESGHTGIEGSPDAVLRQSLATATDLIGLSLGGVARTTVVASPEGESAGSAESGSTAPIERTPGLTS